MGAALAYGPDGPDGPNGQDGCASVYPEGLLYCCDSVLKVKPFFELFLKIIPDCISDQPLS